MRLRRGLLFFCLLILLPVSGTMAADKLTIGAGAGYKRLVEEISAAFTAQSGIHVERAYGNMGQIIPQAKQGLLDFVCADKEFLVASQLNSFGEIPIGRGKLVAVLAKNASIGSISELTSASVTRIAIADTQKAIYGKAARQYLEHEGLWKTLEPKILMVGTVPQVTTYVATGEVEVGFINLTDALGAADKIGQIVPIDEKLYTPIAIVAEQLIEKNAATEALVKFMQSPEAQEIIKKHGL